MIEWTTLPGLSPYEATVAAMEARAAAVRAGTAPEAVWLLEHPALYTAGTSARAADLLDPARLPVHRSGRGGQFTWHGPGQRVAYLMLDLDRHGGDLRAFVHRLEAWVIAALAEFGVAGLVRPDRVGVWVARPEKPPGPDGAPAEDKIAAIGIRLRQRVAFHGIALNVAPDLSHYAGIVPCGIRSHGVTSLADLGVVAGMGEVDAALRRSFTQLFGSG